MRLPLGIEDHTPDTLVIGDANRHAWRALQGWKAWPGGAFALWGPPGAGKSHIAAAWAQQAGAVRVSSADLGQIAARHAGAYGRLWVDDLDQGLDDAGLTLLVDLARDTPNGAVLLCGRGPPTRWPAQSPDLGSRLAALPAAGLHEPDLDLLAAVLRRLAKTRFLELDDEEARYLTYRMERSFAAAHAVIDAIDRLKRRGYTPVSHDLARRALAQLDAREEPSA